MQSASSAMRKKRKRGDAEHVVNSLNNEDSTNKVPRRVNTTSSHELSRSPTHGAQHGKRKGVVKNDNRSNRKRLREEAGLSRAPLPLQSVKENVGSVKKEARSIYDVEDEKEESGEESQSFLDTLSQLGKNRAFSLAQEIKKMNLSKFPMETVAEKLAEKMIAEHKAVESSLDVAVSVRSLLNDLRQSITNPHNDMMKQLQDFDTISQSFGLKNAVNHLDFLDQCISCVCSKLSRKNEETQETTI